MSVRKPLPSWVLPKVPERPLRYVTFGEVIKRSRKGHNLNQTQLAAIVGISRTYLSSIERDKANNLSTNILLRLAQALGVNRCKLLEMYAAREE